MCCGCYQEYGSPIPSENARQLALGLADCDPFGACHIVVEDWNIEDDHIRFCLADARITTAEEVAMRSLLELPITQRAAALAVADGYVQ